MPRLLCEWPEGSSSTLCEALRRPEVARSSTELVVVANASAVALRLVDTCAKHAQPGQANASC